MKKIESVGLCVGFVCASLLPLHAAQVTEPAAPAPAPVPAPTVPVPAPAPAPAPTAPAPAPVSPNISAAPGVPAPAPAEVPAAPAAPAQAEDPNAWQKKVETQLETKAAVEKAGPKELSAEAKQLGTDLLSRQAMIHASRNAPKAEDYFKAQGAILIAMPEWAYQGKTAREQLAATDKSVAAYLKTNKKTLDELATLVAKYKQRLGVKGLPIKVPPRPVPSRAPKYPIGGKITGGGPEATAAPEPIPDLSLDNTVKDGKNPPVKLTATDQFKMGSFEAYIKRLKTYAFRHDYVSAENEYQYAADNIAGAYYLQLMVQQDPRWAWSYPETFKWLEAMDGGTITIPTDDPAPGTAAKPAAAPAKPAPAEAKPEPKKGS